MPIREGTSWSIFIYGTDALSCARQDLEERIEDALFDMGQISGGGAGISGWNIDIEVLDAEAIDRSIRAIAGVLHGAADPDTTHLDVIRSERRSLRNLLSGGGFGV